MRVLALMLLAATGCRASYAGNIRLPVSDAPVAVEGVWSTRWTVKSTVSDTSLSLTQKGSAVTGVYTTHETANGQLSGELRGNELTGEWWEDALHGRFRFVFDATGTRFEGTWGLNDFDDSGGLWDGSRALPP